MCRAYEAVIKAKPDVINNQIFNVSFENKKIIQLAEIVKKNVQNFFNLKSIEIEIKQETVDKRSYHVNSDKIKKILNFNTKFNIDDAVNSLCNAFQDGNLKDSMSDKKYINVSVLKSLNVK